MGIQIKKLAISLNKAKVAIIYRKNTPSAEQVAKEFCVWLNEQNVTIFNTPKQINLPHSKPVTKNNIKQLTLIVVLGGDGTYLEAIRFLEGRPVPILGFNLGSLGFLTQTKVENLHQTVLDTLKGKMQLRARSMMEVNLKKKNRKIKKILALNDVVIERGSSSHLINVAVCRNRRPVLDIKADGVIVASPTGSTAYNLAAGGPILHPEVDAFVLTPICPHSLTSRPLIFSDEQEIEITLNPTNQKASFIIDGQNISDLSAGDQIIIRKTSQPHWIVRNPKHNYFDLLKEKLKFGERD